MPPQAPAEFDSIQDGHHDIANDNVEFVGKRQRQSRGTILRAKDFVSLLFE